MVRALHRNSLNPESRIQLSNEKTIGEPEHSLTPFLHTFPYTFSSLFPFSPANVLVTLFTLLYSTVRACRSTWEVWWEFPWALVWRWRSRRSHLSKPQAGVPHAHATDIISIWWLSHKTNCGHCSILLTGRFSQAAEEINWITAHCTLRISHTQRLVSHTSSHNWLWNYLDFTFIYKTKLTPS